MLFNKNPEAACPNDVPSKTGSSQQSECLGSQAGQTLYKDAASAARLGRIHVGEKLQMIMIKDHIPIKRRLLVSC